MDQDHDLQVKVWGCRGSIATSGVPFATFGGNTTCFEIKSQCLPKGLKLFVDAGTGFVQAGHGYLKEVGNGLEFVTLFTHYHHDHVLGLTLAPPTFIPVVPMTFLGPKDAGIGPREVIESVFRRPMFPVDAKSVMGKMTFKALEGFDVQVIIFHPIGGRKIIDLEIFSRKDVPQGQININGRFYNMDECLVIKMQRANHGNATCISYRFEERWTGKTLVICTDHEDPAEIPKSLLSHFRSADLLIIDGQYSQERYQSQTAGFGHGTPKGIARQALAAKVQCVGITHHDPLFGTDDYLLREIFEPTRNAIQELSSSEGPRSESVPLLREGAIFLCKDYATYGL